MQEENTKINTEETMQTTTTDIDSVVTTTNEEDVSETSEQEMGEIDPIQEAYNSASYDLIKYLSGEEFPRTVELITQANKLLGEQASEVNFICLMLALKIIKYNKETGESVMSMLAKVGLNISISSQVWSDIETYIIPAIPEMDANNYDKGNDNIPQSNIIVNRSVTLDTKTEGAHITHFGPESVEMRLKNVGAPRITLEQLSKGESLLSGVVNIIDTNNKIQHSSKINKAINYNSHPDPYRELVEE